MFELFTLYLGLDGTYGFHIMFTDNGSYNGSLLGFQTSSDVTYFSFLWITLAIMKND